MVLTEAWEGLPTPPWCKHGKPSSQPRLKVQVQLQVQGGPGMIQGACVKGSVDMHYGVHLYAPAWGGLRLYVHGWLRHACDAIQDVVCFVDKGIAGFAPMHAVTPGCRQLCVLCICDVWAYDLYWGLLCECMARLDTVMMYARCVELRISTMNFCTQKF